MNEIFADDYVRHDLRPGNPPPGPAGQKQIAAAFPDIHSTVEMMIAEGNIVVTRWTAEGVNSGQWGGVAPTGKRVRFSGVNVFRIENGKVAEL